MLLENIDPAELALDEHELKNRLSSGERVDYINDNRYLRLLEACSCTYIAERLAITEREGELFLGDIQAPGAAFRRVAKGCSECFVMVCTLGHGVDRLMAKEQHLSVTDAFAIDAMADALIESLCDEAEKRICKGLRTVPRFSPGYADLPLGVGQRIVNLLGADMRLGIRFTESGLMIPKKSVSAIVCVKD